MSNKSSLDEVPFASHSESFYKVVMIGIVDVDYRTERGPAVAALCLVEDWTDARPVGEFCIVEATPAPYQPGAFYLREMPCILSVLDKSSCRPEMLVIDGHVWLDEGTTPGLGAHLYEALERSIPIVGVAKNRFHTTPSTAMVFRGASKKPLYVTVAGIDHNEAVSCIRSMHGQHRLPTLIKRVDRLCREHEI